MPPRGFLELATGILRQKEDFDKMIPNRPQIRYLDEMRKVLFDQEWAKRASNIPLYYMYRGIKEKDDLRYDITVIPSRLLGKEFVKTKGHSHFGKYGELYIVLSGQGIFLFQKHNKGKVEDVYYIKAEKGDYVPIPPFYAHTTINPSSQELKIANWVSKKCLSNYKEIEEMGGFCYYYTTSGWVKNKNYRNVPEIRSEKPQRSEPKNLDFLYGN